jgi:hypothetical protein
MISGSDVLFVGIGLFMDVTTWWRSNLQIQVYLPDSLYIDYLGEAAAEGISGCGPRLMRLHRNSRVTWGAGSDAGKLGLYVGVNICQQLSPAGDTAYRLPF